MIGREEIVTTLVTQLSHQRLVTVVGPGGIGKTTVGLYAIQKLDESSGRSGAEASVAGEVGSGASAWRHDGD
ncbi:MAG: hypothetical protein QOF70_5963 [Acetobacteraceae bacterium]|jgi:predicted ATPase|nr:hypothetical protein [Acetobacteraceae bacterium]